VSALYEGECSASRPGSFTWREGQPVLINGELRRPQALSGPCGEQKNLCPLQAFASRFLVFVPFVAQHAQSYLAFLALYTYN